MLAKITANGIDNKSNAKDVSYMETGNQNPEQ